MGSIVKPNGYQVLHRPVEPTGIIGPLPETRIRCRARALNSAGSLICGMRSGPEAFPALV